MIPFDIFIKANIQHALIRENSYYLTHLTKYLFSHSPIIYQPK